jgi:cell division protein FtsQ
MLKKILKYIIAAAIACYLIFALVIVPSRKDNDKCKEVAIKISNNRLGTITNDDIVAMLQEDGLYPQDKVMDSINCHDIEEFINAMTIVKDCQVYKTNEKRVKIDIICREPVLRYMTTVGTHTMWTLRVRKSLTSKSLYCCQWHRERLMTA